MNVKQRRHLIQQKSLFGIHCHPTRFVVLIVFFVWHSLPSYQICCIKSLLCLAFIAILLVLWYYASSLLGIHCYPTSFVVLSVFFVWHSLPSYQFFCIQCLLCFGIHCHPTIFVVLSVFFVWHSLPSSQFCCIKCLLCLAFIAILLVLLY